MSPENFCYWLQGLLELQPDLKKIDADQVRMIRDHLGYVFTHVHAGKPAPAKAAPTQSNDYLRQYQELVGIAQGIVQQPAASIC